MFSKLPQKLTAPLGLLTDEAKLAFRSRPDGIAKLMTTRVSLSSKRRPPPTEHIAWRRVAAHR